VNREIAEKLYPPMTYDWQKRPATARPRRKLRSTLHNQIYVDVRLSEGVFGAASKNEVTELCAAVDIVSTPHSSSAIDSKRNITFAYLPLQSSGKPSGTNEEEQMHSPDLAVMGSTFSDPSLPPEQEQPMDPDPSPTEKHPEAVEVSSEELNEHQPRDAKAPKPASTTAAIPPMLSLDRLQVLEENDLTIPMMKHTSDELEQISNEIQIVGQVAELLHADHTLSPEGNHAQGIALVPRFLTPL
jgi:hypothetical protein